MSEVENILKYISPNTNFVVNLEDYKGFIQIAKIEERERIIKLLESVETYPADWDYSDPFESVVKLIKKGQK